MISIKKLEERIHNIVQYVAEDDSIPNAECDACQILVYWANKSDSTPVKLFDYDKFKIQQSPTSSEIEFWGNLEIRVTSILRESQEDQKGAEDCGKEMLEMVICNIRRKSSYMQ